MCRREQKRKWTRSRKEESRGGLQDGLQCWVEFPVEEVLK